MRVMQTTIENIYVKTYDSVTDAAKKTGYKRDAILKCCRKEQKTLKGYIFEYID